MSSKMFSQKNLSDILIYPGIGSGASLWDQLESWVGESPGIVTGVEKEAWESTGETPGRRAAEGGSLS